MEAKNIQGVIGEPIKNIICDCNKIATVHAFNSTTLC